MSDIYRQATTILEEAENVVNGARAREYGSVRANFEMIANLWSDYLETEVFSHDVAHMMMLLKIARGKKGYHRDCLVDLAGYSRCAEMLHDSYENED